MIIEIKGLPDGHKIKHINVDITFADGSCVVKTRAEPSQDMRVQRVEHAVQDRQDRQGQREDDDHREVIAAPPTAPPTAPNNDIDTRPKKEIPPEMTDMEF